MTLTFDQTFSADEVSPLPPPALISALVPSAGRFNEGLFSVLDHSLSTQVLRSWRWLLGQDAIALVASSVGDLFFWSEKYSGIYFLEVQRGSSTFVGTDLEWFFTNFITVGEILDEVLHRPLFVSLCDRLQPPRYGECFIAEPWQRLGGSGAVDTYEKGSLDVYTNLLGQAVEIAMTAERARRR
ncbi:T6SS immunity protein Tdi1 domain-containing protein [Dyella terrae]|uniref:T6SS immunity protein Tdi1 domain-containing protein n=1 Tax=Dyella terrae TaxID=522259 RepID=UPI001EFD1FC4|nr:T6SS immunity protein Tdi1 domain-containing protein [Dyella terrae]